MILEGLLHSLLSQHYKICTYSWRLSCLRILQSISSPVGGELRGEPSYLLPRPRWGPPAGRRGRATPRLPTRACHFASDQSRASQRGERGKAACVCASVARACEAAVSLEILGELKRRRDSALFHAIIFLQHRRYRKTTHTKMNVVYEWKLLRLFKR